jgi:hypothetical protein
MWAAADSWYLLTGLAIANALAMITALLAGFTLASVIHEWSHFAGARFSNSSYTIPKKFGNFVFTFDFEKNSLRQFNIMSCAGQIGSWATVLVLLLLIPMDNSGRVLLVASAAGSAVFAAIVEWPVLLRTRHSGEPLQELSKINGQVLKRSGIYATASVLAIWLLFA